jgi:hypothetical protein
MVRIKILFDSTEHQSIEVLEDRKEIKGSCMEVLEDRDERIGNERRITKEVY